MPEECSWWCWVCAYAPFVCRFQLLGLVALCTTCVLLSVILLFAWSSWQVIISKLARPRSVQLWVMWKECELLPNINDLLCVRYTDRRGKKKNDFITWKVTSAICTPTLTCWNFHLILLERWKKISVSVVRTRLPSGLVMRRGKISDDVFCVLAQFGNSCKLFWNSAPRSVPERPDCSQPRCPPLTTTLNFLPNPNLDNKIYPVVALSYSRQFAE